MAPPLIAQELDAAIDRVLRRAAIHAVASAQNFIEGRDVLGVGENQGPAVCLLQQEAISRFDLLNFPSHAVTKAAELGQHRQEI